MTGLKDIFGQDAAIESLRAAYAADRLPHGLIFAGPEGVGKATTALALASLFLCEKPGEFDACGKCESCRAIAAGTHPDYHVITKELARLHDRSGTSKATRLSIEVIRHDVAEPAGRKTVMGRGKVFVVEQAELMTESAQNGLLKTLEEPAGRSLIILLTIHSGELLATVRSRCQTIHFTALPVDWVAGQLKKRGTDAATAAAAAELSDGSLGVAMRWIEDGIVASAATVAQTMDAILDGKSSGNLADLLRGSADAYAEKVLARDELASKDSAVRGGLEIYLSIAARRIRRRLRSAEDANFLEHACDAVEAISRTEKYLDANVNVQLAMEELMGRVAPPGESRLD